MKKENLEKYSKPIVEVLDFHCADIIRTSDCYGAIHFPHNSEAVPKNAFDLYNYKKGL